MFKVKTGQNISEMYWQTGIYRQNFDMKIFLIWLLSLSGILKALLTNPPI